MKRVAGLGLWVAVGLLAAACGSRGKNDGPDYEYPTEQSFCQAVGEMECNDAVVKACYGSDQSSLAEDRASCVAARSAVCNPQALPYHPEPAEDCISARKVALEDAVWTKEEIANVEETCLPVLSKEGPDGAICKTSADCDSKEGLRCLVKFGSEEGVCGEPVVVVGGEDCADPLSVCDAAYYCDPQVNHCLKKPAVDEPCSVAAPCAGDFYCTDPEGGTCVVKTKNGLDCEKNELCSGGFCVGATADTSGVCSSTLPLQINADSCDPYRQ